MSCIFDCAAVAHYHGARIISDGGITCPGDVAKAFGNGADYVMMGGQFAGHEECPGDVVTENGQSYKIFYGMSSAHAMNKNYSKDPKDKSYRTSEGRHMKIKYKGPISNTIDDFLGGLRSTCTYTNHENLSDMIGNLTFIRVNHQYNDSLSKS
jgi:GMP reductase